MISSKHCLHLLFVFTLLLFTISCGDDSDPEPKKSTAKSITSFKLESLTPQIVGTIEEADKKIVLSVASGTSITALIPTIAISSKATIAPASGVAQNFTNPVTYTVTAEDGSSQEYEVSVVVLKSSVKTITSFKFTSFTPEVTGTISETDKKITVTVPKGTSLANLVPTIVTAEKATVSPASGVAKDFTNPVTYTVTAEDGTTQEYEVSVSATKSSAKAITSFKFAGLTPPVTGIITEADKKISLTVPVGTVVTALSPSIELSQKATVSPASGIAVDFSNPVTYTVTAEDGTTEVYEVTVIVSKSDAKNITSFSFAAFTPNVIGTIDQSTKTISLTVPSGTDVTALSPTIITSEKASISPSSGMVQNFTNPIKYTVTAENGTVQEYTITVSVGVTFTITDIASFQLEQDGTIGIFGSNMGSYENNKIVMINKNDNSLTYDLPALNSSTSQYIYARVPANLPLGQYYIEVFVGSQSKLLNDTFTVEVHAPEITTVNKTKVFQGKDIIITGKYFTASNNTVTLEYNSTVVTLSIVSQSTTSITAKVPESTAVGTQYILHVESNSKKTFYTNYISVETPPTVPTITDVNKTTFSRGEKIIIYGFNLKKSGFATNINFLPVNGGVTIIRSGSANAEGTQVEYTFSDTFTLGEYNIVIEVDFEFSEEYSSSITVNP